MLDETKQGVNYRLANIVAKLPEVRAMFPVMSKALNDGAQKSMEEAVAVWRERGLMPLRQTDYATFLDRTVLKAWRERRAAEKRAERERVEAEALRRAPTLFDLGAFTVSQSASTRTQACACSSDGTAPPQARPHTSDTPSSPR